MFVCPCNQHAHLNFDAIRPHSPPWHGRCGADARESGVARRSSWVAIRKSSSGRPCRGATTDFRVTPRQHPKYAPPTPRRGGGMVFRVRRVALRRSKIGISAYGEHQQPARTVGPAGVGVATRRSGARAEHPGRRVAALAALSSASVRSEYQRPNIEQWGFAHDQRHRASTARINRMHALPVPGQLQGPIDDPSASASRIGTGAGPINVRI